MRFNITVVSMPKYCKKILSEKIARASREKCDAIHLDKKDVLIQCCSASSSRFIGVEEQNNPLGFFQHDLTREVYLERQCVNYR